MGAQADTARSRVLDAINHVQPASVPFNVIGFDPVDPWLSRFDAAQLPRDDPSRVAVWQVRSTD